MKIATPLSPQKSTLQRIWQRIWTQPLLGLGLGIGALIGFLTPASFADDQSSLTALVNFYGGDEGTSLTGMNGYGITFSSESKSKLIRPNFVVGLEYASGTPTGGEASTLMGGNIGGGVGLYMFKTNFVSPFIGLNGLLGWGTVSTADASSIAITYGGTIYGGTEIRFSSKPNAKAFRITTGYRVLLGGFSSVTTLNSLIFGLGMIF